MTIAAYLRDDLEVHAVLAVGGKSRVIELGFVGCGDVAIRTYFPALAPLAGRIRVAACFDPQVERAEAAAALFPGATALTYYEDLLGQAGLDAIVNLTPAPFHREVTSQAIAAGLHVYSEKPLAATVPEAHALIEQANQAGKLLLSAPAVMATRRFRWLKELITAGCFGRPTLATAQMANMGPASWRGYTGDPGVFYQKGVGPVLDTGVYILHAITGLLGPVKRIQAFGGIAIPKRTVLIERLAGQTIDVTANDQMLIQLDFGGDTFAQVLSSFAVPATRAPALELHGTGGSFSIATSTWYDANGPVDIYRRDDTPLGLEGWILNVSPPNPSPHTNLIGAGVPHFVDCILGDAEPILTAAHARHVLEVILAAGRAVQECCVVELSTSF